MKKRLISLLLSILLCAFVTAGCVTNGGTSSTPLPSPSPSPTPDGDGGTGVFKEKDGTYSVRLILDGEIFTPTEGMSVQWTDGASVVRAQFDSDGVARQTGLDGDYTITLHNLASEYRYNPNGIVATSDDEDIEIEVYEYIRPSGSGVGLYSCINVNRMGAYSCNIKAAGQVVYYQFSPVRSGIFSIETIVDTTEDTINPIFDIYTGSTQAKYFNRELNDGGTYGNYTRNVRYVINVAAENLSSGGGGISFTIGLKATHRDSIYPLEVQFLLRYEGSYAPPKTDKTIITANQEDLASRGAIAQPEGKMKYPEVKIEGSNAYRFDEKLFGYDETLGVWRKKDENGNPTGPILYAQITKSNRFLLDNNGSEVSFATVESVSGTSVLTLEDGKEWWKVFIEGGGQVGNVVGLENYTGYRGLRDYITNADGVYPVTNEVKTFLQKFSIAQRYFSDGNGWAETTAEDVIGYRIYATENDQWLFGVCYYE